MLYLIHEEQRKKVIDRYYTHVLQTVLWVFVGVCSIVAILAVPTVILLQTEVKVTSDTISMLESDIRQAESKDFEGEVSKITNKIDLLKRIDTQGVHTVYSDIVRIVEGVSGVRIQNVSVDSLTKTIQLVMEVRDKEVAKNLVDVLQKTKYKGAEVSYAVLSQKASFTFPQKLTYE